MRKFIFSIGITACFLFVACSGFIEQYPKDQVYASSSEDLNELLVGEGYMPASTGNDIGVWIHLMDDDVTFVRRNSTRPTECDFFWWTPDPKTTTWKALYKRIGVINAILDEIDNFKGEPGDNYRKVKGEAYFLRAAYYYFLVNIYAKPYYKESASTDMGVPLKLFSKVENKRYVRSPLQECYDQISSDLKNAILYLKGLTPVTTYRTGEMASRHLLSRVYLYMGEWNGVVSQCDTILSSYSYQLLDYNVFGDVNKTNATSATSPETIFTSGANSYNNSWFDPQINSKFQGSDEILALYEPTDLRRVYYFRGATGGNYGDFWPCKLANRDEGNCSNFFLFRLPEIYLNKAEALTVLGENQEAINLLQELRKRRLQAGSSYEVDVNLAGKELMDIVRAERRREFTFEGQRWFDLRRYAVHPVWPYQREIRHAYYESADLVGDIVLRTYDEDSEYYVLPIPDSEIILNSGFLLQNEMRALKEPGQ